jgi:hypothetical protein
MRKNNFLSVFCILFTVLFCVSLLNCKNEKRSRSQNSQLAVPANVKVEVAGRWMTVSWNAVNKAVGYQIYTTSTGCNSGNKIINTKTQTATNHAGTASKNVEFLNPTSVRILLMAARGNTAEPMASAVSAKVMALAYDDTYIDSAYSDVKTVSKANYLSAKE